MKAVILAGGRGTRLREVVSDVPKPMAQVGGKPFLEHIVLQLKAAGLREIILSLGYKMEVIKSHFSDGGRWGVSIGYAEEKEPLGTGGGVREALANVEEDNTLVMNGDSFLSVNIAELVRYHEERAAMATMALTEREDAARYGAVAINERGEVFGFAEKGKGGRGWVNGGVYVVRRGFRTRIPEGSSSLERDVFPGMVGAGLYGMQVRGFFVDIGIPEDYAFACENHRLLI